MEAPTARGLLVGARIIGCVGHKGGVGKSSLAAHLAVWLAARGERVTVLDTDLQASCAAWLPEAAPHLQVVVERDAERLFDGTIPQLAAECDRLVIDSGGGDHGPARAVLGHADAVLIPSGPGALDLGAAADSVRQVQRYQQMRQGTGPRLVLIANRIAPQQTLLGREALEALRSLGVPVAETVVHQRVGLADCVGQGATAFDYGPAAKSADELHALFSELCNAAEEPQVVHQSREDARGAAARGRGPRDDASTGAEG